MTNIAFTDPYKHHRQTTVLFVSYHCPLHERGVRITWQVNVHKQPPGGGHLYLKLDVILIKKIHVTCYMMDKLKKCMQKHIFRVYFHTWKYVFRVCFKSPFTRMISSLKYKCPPTTTSTWNCSLRLHCHSLVNNMSRITHIMTMFI